MTTPAPAATPAATPEPTPPATPPAATEPVDFLTAEIDDPVFKTTEPYKGLPAEKDILSGLPEDAKKWAANIRSGYAKQRETDKAATRAAEEAKAAAEARAAELEARLAEMRTPAPAAAEPAKPPVSTETAVLSDPKVRRLLGLEDGDFLEGVDTGAPEVDVDALVAGLDDDALSDPEKMRAALAGAFKATLEGASKHARAVAARAAAEAMRATTRPYVDAKIKTEAETAEAALRANLSAWRSANPGMADDAAFDAVLDVAEELGIKHDPTGKMRDLSAAYAVWAQGKELPKPAAPAAPPPAPAPVVESKPDPIAAFRDAALAAQGRGASGGDAGAPRMPAGLTTEQQLKWLDAHPEARAALRGNPLGARI